MSLIAAALASDRARAATFSPDPWAGRKPRAVRCRRQRRPVLEIERDHGQPRGRELGPHRLERLLGAGATEPRGERPKTGIVTDQHERPRLVGRAAQGHQELARRARIDRAQRLGRVCSPSTGAISRQVSRTRSAWEQSTRSGPQRRLTISCAIHGAARRPRGASGRSRSAKSGVSQLDLACRSNRSRRIVPSACSPISTEGLTNPRHCRLDQAFIACSGPTGRPVSARDCAWRQT